MELQLQHLCKHYGTKHAVNDVSTTLTPGVYSNRFSVVNLHHENGKVRLRMIHDTAPTADAITVPPSLEDLFLYHFGEEAGEERGE